MFQLAQELHQSQVDKQNLERHIQKETLQHKEVSKISPTIYSV